MRKKANWELFEEDCCDYLNERFADSPIIFKGEGGTDSSASDIKVFHQGRYLFSIEAKYSPSQSGQFVILEKNNLYTFSPINKFENNEYTEAIINYLNKHKEQYTPKGQVAIEINIDKEILANWIKHHYKQKDSYFLITSTKVNDYKAIIPIDEINEYFNVSAVVRRKKSGSRDVAKYKLDSCLQQLKEYLQQKNLTVSEVVSIKKKTLVKLDEEIKLNQADRYFGDNYYLSPNRNGDGFYIKQLSTTNNINVIFSLVYTGPEKSLGIDLLQQFIQRSL